MDIITDSPKYSLESITLNGVALDTDQINVSQEEIDERTKAFSKFQVTTELLDEADENVIFLHCLPAIRGQEVTSEVMEDERSKVWQQAENRLHVQQSLLEFLLAN